MADWKNLKIEAKEFIAGIVFVFSISGLYYKLYYENDKNAVARAAYERQNDIKLDKLSVELESVKREVNELRDAEIRRKAVEELRTQISVPLNKTR